MKARDANDILREHGADRLREEIDSAPGPNGKDPHARSRFSITEFENIKLNTSPSYVVKGILPRDGLQPSGVCRNAENHSGCSIS